MCDSKPSALSLNARSKSLDRKSSKSCYMTSASSMSSINTQENLYMGLEKSVSDTIATTAGHSHEVCSDGTQCKCCSTPLCNLNPELEEALKTDSASLTCTNIIHTLDAVHSNGASSQISHSPSTPILRDQQKENPNNANNNNNNNNFYSNKIKKCNEKINNNSSLQQIKKMVLPPAYPSHLPLYLSSMTGSLIDNRGGQSLRPPANPLHKRYLSEPYILPISKNELVISTVNSTQKFFQQWQQQIPMHQQSQLLQKQHIKKHTKLHNLVLQKSAPLPSPSFDLTVKQQQYTPRPPVHRPQKATNLYKANR